MSPTPRSGDSFLGLGPILILNRIGGDVITVYAAAYLEATKVRDFYWYF